MRWSIRIATVRGIPIRVHATFLLIVLWAAWIGLTEARGPSKVDSAAYMVLFTLLLFVCVVLHELGHSLVAQAFGVKVHDITLWPVGGVARLAGMPRRPAHEFLITAAGPTVNVILAVVLAGLAFAWIGPDQLLRVLATGRGIARLLDAQTGQSLVVLLALQNVLLAMFNLIPAFPMDGGRLLRSVLAAFLPFRSATRAASFTGQALAVALLAVSFIPPGNFFLTLVAGFVFLGAWQERSQVSATENLAGMTVRDAMQPLGARLSASDPLIETVRRHAAASQVVYVVVQDNRLAGTITRAGLLAAAKKANAADTVGTRLSKHTIQVSPAEPLIGVQERLQGERTGVVVDGGAVVGLITRSDIARLAEAIEVVQNIRQPSKSQA